MEIEEALEYVTDTAHFETGEVLAKVGPLYKQFFGDRKGFIIADESTYVAAGEKTAMYLTSAGIELGAPRIFPAEPMLPCEYEISMVLRDEIKARKAVPIAVGSGTINDLVKVAAFEAGTKYMVVATAASVDGYSAPGASMVRNGFKNSIFCTAPYVIIADTEVLSSAPDKMTSAGYADLSSKYTAGADWIIADCVRSDPIDDLVWRMVQEDLDLWLENPAGVITGSETAFAALFRGLTMTGLAMQKARKSRPASGAEHLMSHIWEMKHLAVDGVPVSHGYKVAIATLGVTALMERIFTRNAEDFDISALVAGRPAWENVEARITELFDSPIREGTLKETREKYGSNDELGKRLESAISGWDEMRKGVQQKLVPYADLRDRFHLAGAPVLPETIGLAKREVCAAYEPAGMIRNRYTCIDLAVELGIFEACVKEVEESDIYLC